MTPAASADATLPDEDQTGAPTDYAYWRRKDSPRIQRARSLTRTLLGFDLCPDDETAQRLTEGLWQGDPLAEAFVDETMATAAARGQTKARFETALSDGIDAVDDAPATMRALFTEFEAVPAWVRPDLVEQGAAIWRRWGTDLFAVAGASTLEMYTESAIALPLSMTGGYAGDKALHRFLETVRFWIATSEPGALLTPGSEGRAIAMRVRVMHVSVRRRVADHDEWNSERWGMPIGQTPMLYTLMGGSVAPAMMLWQLGHITTPSEIRALLHFQRYLGHLLGVNTDAYPESVAEGIQVLAFATLSRTYTAGEAGAELIESFPRAFDVPDDVAGLERLRRQYLKWLMDGFTLLYTSPRSRRGLTMPPAVAMLAPLSRIPLIAGTDIARRVIPGLDARLDRRDRRARERWLESLLAGRETRFEAGGLRR